MMTILTRVVRAWHPFDAHPFSILAGTCSWLLDADCTDNSEEDSEFSEDEFDGIMTKQGDIGK